MPRAALKVALQTITNRRRAVGVHHTNSRHDLYTVTVLKMRRLNFNGSIQSPFNNPPDLTHYKKYKKLNWTKDRVI